MIFHLTGHRCGYVGIPKNHKYYKSFYGDLENISCHGGLTYSESHLVGQDDKDTWWIGFDCAHFMDDPDFESVEKYFKGDEYKDIIKFSKNFNLKDYVPAGLNIPIIDNHGVVRDLEYVMSECKYIVDQIEGGIRNGERRENEQKTKSILNKKILKRQSQV